jgi:hypothetical protein
MLKMSKKYIKLSCAKETSDLLLIECKEEFLKNHPEMKGMFLSQNFILLKVTNYYLGKK